MPTTPEDPSREFTPPPSARVPRRDFIQQLAAVAAAAQLGLSATSPVSAQQTTAPASPTPLPTAPPDNLVGVQMGAHTMLDEGIDHCLDFIQENAAINTLFVYSHAYGGDLKKPLAWLATDHGVPVRDQQKRNLPLVYVKQHDQYFKDTTLRHAKVDDTMDYHDRDLFAEMVEPARKRGMKIYARILEAGPRGIENFSKVVTVNVNGRHTQTACWNHPQYKAFWNATVEDLFRSYDLDGFQWGAERQSPLLGVLFGGNEAGATCFCEHCVARGKALGIDPERARKGYVELCTYIQSLRANAKPLDGTFAGFIRVLFHYPEILAWEFQYRLAKEETMKAMYATIKAIKPTAPVGWHIDHWAISMNPFYRAEMSYAEMAPYSDYLKVVVYHAALGPRMLSYIQSLHRGILGDVPIDDLFNLQYALLGYDKTTEPTAAAANHQGFSANYVYRETKHSVASAQGKTKIYPGIGFNLPSTPPDDPETIYNAVIKAYEAGAAGFVASREYEEMTLPNLKAVGQAVRALPKATKA